MTRSKTSPPVLRSLISDWTELKHIDLDRDRFHVVALELHRTPTPAELEGLDRHFRKLLVELEENGVKAVGMVLVPGQKLQVFELEKPKPKRGRRRR